MKQHILGKTILVIVATVSLFVACNRMDVGYLKADQASFAPDTLFAYRQPDPATPRAENGAPWVSTRIQGVAGTAPINYEIVGVSTDDSSAESLFNEAVKAGEIKVQGGLIVVHQAAVKRLSNGAYRISLRVFNEDHSQLLANVLTLVIDDVQPASDVIDNGGDDDNTPDAENDDSDSGDNNPSGGDDDSNGGDDNPQNGDETPDETPQP